MRFKDITKSSHQCPHCGGPMFSELMMMEKKDACYYKVKASAKVWPSAYASGRLVQCRKKGAGNYGNKSEGVEEAANPAQQAAIAIAKKKEQGMAEGGKKKKKKSSRSQGYFFPGYGYYGSGDSGEGGGDGGGESMNRGIAEGSMRQKLGNIIKQAVQDDQVAYNSSPLYQKLWGMYGGDIDAIIAERSIFELEKLARELITRKQQGMAEGMFGSKQSPALPVVNKIASIAGKLTPQNVNVGRQIIQSHAAELSRMLSPQAKAGVDVIEDYNAEYDDEAGMADNNLSTLRRAVEGLDDLIDTGDNLPEWCQEKIAVAKSMLVAVWDYMESEDDAEEDPEIEEMYESLESLVEELSARTNVDVESVWETFEALDDHKLYETAAWRRKEGKSKSGGLNAKGVASYRRENPGSKLQTAVTTKPSKLKPGSKAAKRRKSFCARMSGVKGPMKKPNGKPTRKALALRKWNC